MSTNPQKGARCSDDRAVIVVSGLPRSGTSMTMAMLASGGLPCISDGARAADEDNPRGYFEDARVKALGDDCDWLRDVTGHVVKIVSPLLAHLPRGPDYAVLFMRRDLDEVLASQARMMERRGEQQTVPDEDMKRYFESHLQRVDAMLRQRDDMHFMYVEHREVLRDPRGQAHAIAAYLDLPLDLECMAAAVDTRLYRNRRA